MKGIEIAWIRNNGHLAHIGDGTEELLGWSAREIMAMDKPFERLVLPPSLEYLQSNYYIGPPGSIMPRAFPVWLRHKDGREICARFIVVCRYDEGGDLAEAWGCAQHCQQQCALNGLLEWWPHAEPVRVAALAHVVEACCV